MKRQLESSLALAGRRALITGADSGIGAAISRGFAAQGADLVVHHLGGADRAAAVAALAVSIGCKADVIELDLREPGAGRAIAEAALLGGPVDILVLNASVEIRGQWTALTADVIAEHVAANLTASFELVQALVPQMAARGWGRVIALGSIMASRPRSETLIYAALKSAQRVALNAIARDVAAQGVTVNTLSPGAIYTDRNAERLSDPDILRGVTAKIPAGRAGCPDDIVGPALMLACDAGGYVTGADIPVDGGWSIGDAMAASS